MPFDYAQARKSALDLCRRNPGRFSPSAFEVRDAIAADIKRRRAALQLPEPEITEEQLAANKRRLREIMDSLV